MKFAVKENVSIAISACVTEEALAESCRAWEAKGYSIEDSETFATPKEVKIEEVSRTYNGKTGCACGCGGSYTHEGDTSATAKKRVAFVNKNLDHATVDYWVDEYCIEVENESGTRVTRVYVKVGA